MEKNIFGKIVVTQAIYSAIFDGFYYADKQWKEHKKNLEVAIAEEKSEGTIQHYRDMANNFFQEMSVNRRALNSVMKSYS